MPNVSKAKLDLIRKIVSARLTKDELQAVTLMAQELIRRRSTEEQTKENEKPLSDKTDTNGKQ